MTPPGWRGRARTHAGAARSRGASVANTRQNSTAAAGAALRGASVASIESAAPAKAAVPAAVLPTPSPAPAWSEPPRRAAPPPSVGLKSAVDDDADIPTGAAAAVLAHTRRCRGDS